MRRQRYVGQMLAAEENSVACLGKTFGQHDRLDSGRGAVLVVARKRALADFLDVGHDYRLYGLAIAERISAYFRNVIQTHRAVISAQRLAAVKRLALDNRVVLGKVDCHKLRVVGEAGRAEMHAAVDGHIDRL